MPRIRTVKPEFWGDEKLAPMAALDRLVFLGLISMADDAGRLVDNVKTIDGFIFPETEESSRESLESLAAAGRIIRYRSQSGQKLIQVANWKKHQKVDNPAKYTLPAPDSLDSPSRDTSEGQATGSRSDLRPSTNDQLSPTVENRPATDEPRESERRAVADALEQSARERFAEHFDEVDRFLRSRPPNQRADWLRSMLRACGPTSQFTPEDVAVACSDALVSDPPITGAHALRAFAEKRRQERSLTTVPPSERPGARRTSPILSVSDSMFDKIMALIQSEPSPGHGVSEFIRKKDVWDLGPPVASAYDAVGGATAFIGARGDAKKIAFLRRDFAAAFARAINTKPPDDGEPPAAAGAAR